MIPCGYRHCNVTDSLDRRQSHGREMEITEIWKFPAQFLGQFAPGPAVRLFQAICQAAQR